MSATGDTMLMLRLLTDCPGEMALVSAVRMGQLVVEEVLRVLAEGTKG